MSTRVPQGLADGLSSAERLNWHRLIASENVGPITFYRLLERFGSAGSALGALPDLARRGGRRSSLRIGTLAEAEAEIARLEAIGARLVARGEPGYPPLLAEIDDAPPLIRLKGRAEVFGRPAVGVVGARNASLNGQRFARELAADLGRRGFAVVSGLARGIDAAAHAGALATGTAAVIAGGIDTVYPKENALLQAEIAEKGLLLTEAPTGLTAQARHFPQRNRLISGSCLGLVVVEASAHSGSLITARLALDQGRDVMAVPGFPTDPRARGTNDLIRQGAVLVEGAEDVVRALGPVGVRAGEPAGSGYRAQDTENTNETTLAAARTAIVTALGPAPVPVDELLRSSQFSPAAVLTVLLELELAGRLERQPGGRVSLIAER